jgi:hypothetical protein
MFANCHKRQGGRGRDHTQRESVCVYVSDYIICSQLTTALCDTITVAQIDDASSSLFEFYDAYCRSHTLVYASMCTELATTGMCFNDKCRYRLVSVADSSPMAQCRVERYSVVRVWRPS